MALARSALTGFSLTKKKSAPFAWKVVNSAKTKRLVMFAWILPAILIKKHKNVSFAKKIVLFVVQKPLAKIATLDTTNRPIQNA